MTRSRAAQVRTPEAEAMCVLCGHREWFGPNDARIEPGMAPTCPKCFGPMASTGKARVR